VGVPKRKKTRGNHGEVSHIKNGENDAVGKGGERLQKIIAEKPGSTPPFFSINSLYLISG